MDRILEKYRYLWESGLDDHFLLKYEEDGKTKYSIKDRARSGGIWIKNQKIHDLLVNKLLQSGIEVVDWECYLEFQLEQYVHLWTTELDEHVLVSYSGKAFEIVSARGTTHLIEDDDLHNMIVEKMLEAKVRVIKPDEVNAFFAAANKKPGQG